MASAETLPPSGPLVVQTSTPASAAWKPASDTSADRSTAVNRPDTVVCIPWPAAWVRGPEATTRLILEAMSGKVLDRTGGKPLTSASVGGTSQRHVELREGKPLRTLKNESPVDSEGRSVPSFC